MTLAKQIDKLGATALEIKAQRDRYEKALRDLVDRLEFVHNHEHYKSVWTLYMIHGGDYSNGPTYKAELDSAQEALRCE